MNKLGHLWSTLVAHNPMAIEVVRIRRRYLSVERGNSQAQAVVGLTLIIYATLLMIVGNLRGDMPPMVLNFILLFLLTVLVPATLHGSIAGERERRSWEMLAVAPVTHAQIVVGKFLAGAATIGFLSALMVVPLVYAGMNFRRTDWLATGLGLVMAVSFALALAAFTLFLSARVRRPFIALAMVLGTLLVTLVVFPVVMFSTGVSYYGPLLTSVNPYLSLAALGDRGNFANNPESLPLPIEFLAVPQIAANLFIAVAFLVWTERTLAFADNEVRFLPGKKTRS